MAEQFIRTILLPDTFLQEIIFKRQIPWGSALFEQHD